MSHNEARKQHLTDLEFSDLLAGTFAGRSAETHLAGCEHCRRELDVVRGSLGSFCDLSTTWAHAAAPARVPFPSRLALRLGGKPSWGAGLAATAMAAVFAVGFGLPGVHTPASAATTAKAIAVPPTTSELADDNRLMLSIDQELNAEPQPAVPASQLRAEARHDVHRDGEAVLD